jgi:ribosomal protein S13
MQVLCRYICSHQRISLEAIITALNDISIHVVERLKSNLILDGKLDHSVNALIKRIKYGSGDSFDGYRQ